jgi:hypothetical protein
MKKLSEIVVQSGVRIFRDITSVALFSLISSLVLVPAILVLPIPFAAALLCLLYMPLVTGAIYAGNEMLSGQKAKLSSMLRGTIQHYVSSLLFGMLSLLFVLIIISSWWYYGNKSGLFYFALAVFQTYFVAMFFISQLYTLPLLVQEKVGIWTAIGRSAKLFIKHPGYTVGAFLQMLSIGVLLLLTVVGFAGLYVGSMAIYMNLLTRNLLPKEEENEGAQGSKDSWTLMRDQDHFQSKESTI